MLPLTDYSTVDDTSTQRPDNAWALEPFNRVYLIGYMQTSLLINNNYILKAQPYRRKNRKNDIQTRDRNNETLGDE